MNHGSLFSGIGGFDLAAEWMGWQNLFNCEWEEFPRKVLKHHFPNAKQYGDIKEFDAATYAGRIDILTGGFPCQPYSSAGKRKGKEDERHLWPEMLRVIRECSPRWVVGENVRGLVNWNGGLVFEEVCADLEAYGYSVQPFVLPACAVNAPHRRDRVWFVAHRNTDGEKRRSAKREVQKGQNTDTAGNSEQLRRFVAPDTDSRRLEGTTQSGRDCLNVERESISRNAPDTYHARTNKPVRTDGKRQEKNEKRQRFTQFKSGKNCSNAPDTDGAGRRQDNRQGKSGQFDQTRSVGGWENFPTESPLCGGDDGLPKELDGITFPKWRRESIKAYGNAIVPQVAYEIFQAIKNYEND